MVLAVWSSTQFPRPNRQASTVVMAWAEWGKGSWPGRWETRPGLAIVEHMTLSTDRVLTTYNSTSNCILLAVVLAPSKDPMISMLSFGP